MSGRIFNCICPDSARNNAWLCFSDGIVLLVVALEGPMRNLKWRRTMNQDKIGKFIAKERKAKGLTQRQLAERLNISDKTVSKWECGKGLPEVMFMLP